MFESLMGAVRVCGAASEGVLNDSLECIPEFHDPPCFIARREISLVLH
jgi:hypothetical protein